MKGKLLVGTLVKGTWRRQKEARVVLHDMVSEAPLAERIEEMTELVKDLPGIELALPAKPHHPWADKNQRGWPEIGWLVKRNDAPVRLTKEMTISADLLHLDRYQVY